MDACREFTEAEYRATFSPPMLDVTQSAEVLVDLWAYLDPVLDATFPGDAGWEWHVKHIYESRDGVYQHIYVPVPRSDAYMLVVLDKQQRQVLGHYLLDLAALYRADA